MNDNEKAAIAARLWEPSCGSDIIDNDEGYKCPRCAVCGQDLDENLNHRTAPDMHAPSNWLQGLENLTARGLYVDACFYPATAGPYVRFTIWPKGRRISEPPLAEACGPIADVPLFTALVELYDAEHPDEMEDETR